MGVLLALGLCSCSSGATESDIASDAELKQEYNSDLENLYDLLAEAQALLDQIEAMEPINQYDADEVNHYNSLVDQYNNTADRYRSAAQAFNEKYAATAEGTGSGTEVDPNQIQLPDYIE